MNWSSSLLRQSSSVGLGSAGPTSTTRAFCAELLSSQLAPSMCWCVGLFPCRGRTLHGHLLKPTTSSACEGPLEGHHGHLAIQCVHVTWGMEDNLILILVFKPFLGMRSPPGLFWVCRGDQKETSGNYPQRVFHLGAWISLAEKF